MKKTRGRIVLGVTASIAAYKACEIVNQLKKDNFEVKVIMTNDASKFVAPLTFQTLSENSVNIDMFAPPDVWNPMHISLADWADLILVAPATACIIGKIANGICDDLLSCVVVSSKAPVLFAPAMNEKMYLNKAVEENIDKLKKLKYKFVGPIKGHLACGCSGIGHIAPVEKIVTEAKKAL